MNDFEYARDDFDEYDDDEYYDLGNKMVSNVDLILASILTANLAICPIVGLPNCFINILACVVSVLCLLYRNVEAYFDDDMGDV